MKNKELQDRRNILMKEIGVAENRMEASKSKISVIEPQYEFYQENEAEAFEHIHNNGLDGYTYLIRRLRDNYIVGEVKL